MQHGEAQLIVQQIHQTFDRWMYLEDHTIVDLVCGTVLANQMRDGLAVWLALVGPPSTGKTTIAESLYGLPGVWPVDELTKNTFSSGRVGRKAGDRIGLLEKLSDERGEGGEWISHGTKFLVFNDMGTLFAQDQRDKAAILAQMRKVYDGEVHEFWGSGKEFHWQGHVGAILCSTGDWDEEMRRFRQMGDRMLVWRERAPEDRFRAGQVALQQERAVMKRELREAMKLLDRYEPGPAELPADDMRVLGNLAEWAGLLRTAVPRDPYTRQIVDVPEEESAVRMLQQLAQLAKGLRLFRGWELDLEEVETAIYAPLAKMILDSVQTSRFLVMETLRLEPGLTVREIARKCRLDRNLVHRTLADLRAVGLLVLDGETPHLAREVEQYMRRLAETARREMARKEAARGAE